LLPLAVDWQQMLIVLSIGSLAIGNITAIAQTNLKRMLAYSTIGQMGFMLLAMLSGVVGGDTMATANAYSAAMFYVITYAVTTLGTFGIILLLARQGFEAEEISDLRGLNKRSPWYAFVMLLLMFSLAGVPPTAGFYAKLAVLSAVVNAGLVWLAVVAVVLSLIGAFYYLRIVKLMYFDAPADPAPVAGNGEMRALLSANGLALLVLGVLPQPLMSVCFIAIKSL
jgi:NADH-quinone oxidoreductase subunit N